MSFTTEWGPKRARKAARARRFLEKQQAVARARQDREEARMFQVMYLAALRERDRQLRVLTKYRARLAVFRAKACVHVEGKHTGAYWKRKHWAFMCWRVCVSELWLHCLL